MSLERLKVKQVLRFGVLLSCLGLEAWLLCYNLLGRPGVNTVILLSFASLALMSVLTMTGILPIPAGLKIPFINIWPRLSDSVKALTSFLAIFVWTPLALQLTPDTAVGVMIILAPDALFALAALVYLSNGLSSGD